MDRRKIPLSITNTFLLFSILLAFASVFIAVGVLLGTYLTSFQQLPPEPMVSLPTRIPTLVPTTDQTANWKTYTNNKYGFSFNYPKEWFIIENSQSNIVRIDDKPLTKFEDEQGMGPYYSEYISFEVHEKIPRDVQINDPIGTKKCEGDAYCVQKVSDLTIGGKNAAKMKITTKNTLDSAYWYEVGLSAQIIKITNESQKEYKFQILDQILSTFRFTQ